MAESVALEQGGLVWGVGDDQEIAAAILFGHLAVVLQVLVVFQDQGIGGGVDLEVPGLRGGIAAGQSQKDQPENRVRQHRLAVGLE